MQTLVSIIEIILILTVLATIHELGHFLMAKAFKIEVAEFGLGLPPRARRLFTWGGTDFTLNWIPFGAFVLPKGENDPSIPGGLGAAPPLARLVVLFGGPVFNLIAGVLVFAAVFTQTGAPINDKVMIARVLPTSEAGLKTGDIFISINGQPINDIQQAIAIIRAQPGKNVDVIIERDGQTLALKPVAHANPLIPVEYDALRVFFGNWWKFTPVTSQELLQTISRVTGVTLVGEIGQFGVSLGHPFRTINFLEALPLSIETVGEQARTIFMLPVRLIEGSLSPEESRISGPVGIATVFVQIQQIDAANAAEGGLPGIYTLNLIAAISVALGVANLLPLPALDGGRILFVLIELILRRRVPAKYENTIHATGILLLLGLLVLLTIQDIFNPVVLQF
jgi:regulator of sigma E protease